MAGMDKPTQIKAQLVGQNALIVLIALVATHFARKYEIEVSTDTIMLAAAAVGAWWTNRHVNKTSARLDVGTVLSGLTFPEVKAIADRAEVIKADPNNPANTTKDAIIATMQQVAAVQQRIPDASIVEALNATKPIKEQM